MLLRANTVCFYKKYRLECLITNFSYFYLIFKEGFVFLSLRFLIDLKVLFVYWSFDKRLSAIMIYYESSFKILGISYKSDVTDVAHTLTIFSFSSFFKKRLFSELITSFVKIINRIFSLVALSCTS